MRLLIALGLIVGVAGSAAAAQSTAVTSCVQYAPTRTEPGYYDGDHRWHPPKVIKGECVKWKTVTTTPRPSSPPKEKTR